MELILDVGGFLIIIWKRNKEKDQAKINCTAGFALILFLGSSHIIK
jgi:hypothetical protein